LKQITILSGKGGTGKTTITASFAALSKNKVLADCDVDAPNLHLLLRSSRWILYSVRDALSVLMSVLWKR